MCGLPSLLALVAALAGCRPGLAIDAPTATKTESRVDWAGASTLEAVITPGRLDELVRSADGVLTVDVGVEPG